MEITTTADHEHDFAMFGANDGFLLYGCIAIKNCKIRGRRPIGYLCQRTAGPDFEIYYPPRPINKVHKK
jgi:hypothetical protein